MSVQREAPSISRTRSPTTPTTNAFGSTGTTRRRVTIIELLRSGTDGGPNFCEFVDDVLYSIYIDNDGGRPAEITYQFQFHTTTGNNGDVPLQQRPMPRSTTRTGTSASLLGLGGRLDFKGKNRSQTEGHGAGQNLALPPLHVALPVVERGFCP